jgi:Ca2+-transporting ATPase
MKLQKFTRLLSVAVGLMAVFIFVVGIVSGRSAVEMFTLAVAMAVSAIPEGLVVALTAILAVGMQRILKRKALVRKLVAAEVLGSVSVICTDKTGTLTRGLLRVSGVDLVDESLGLAAMYSAAELKDPMEVAMWEWASSQLGPGGVEKVKEEYSKLDRSAFTSERRYSLTLTEKEWFVVGAPELLLQRSRMNQKDRDKWLEKIEVNAKRGYRIVGLAHKRRKIRSKNIEDFKAVEQWYWLGLVEYKDEVRVGVKKALKQAMRAGMKVMVITGDYKDTAMHVMKELDLIIDESEVMEGEELAKIDEHELDERIGEISLFARTSPVQKLKIVESLQRNGEVVAMTGDGVNDAPAVKRADIGIVVSSASDVAKETADMVLLNDDFSSIMAAVEEGRGIYENLRKVMLYLLSDSFSELVIIGVAIVLRWPMPILAAQILWVNLANDALPNLALTMEPKDSDLLTRKPRDREAPLIDREMGTLMTLMSITSAVAILLLFRTVLHLGYSLPQAQTMAFLLLGVDSLVYVFSCKSLTKPVWKVDIGNNRWLLAAVVLGFGVMAMGVYWPIFQQFLGTVPVGTTAWLMVVGIAVFELLWVELIKLKVFKH